LQVRGDIARAIMYMAVCYGLHQPGGQNLHLSDSPSIGKLRKMVIS
jgi:endonuclease I